VEAVEVKTIDMAKKVSWLWGGKRYYGDLIRETSTHKFARTHNGKIKKIKKKK
tara:strand:- start:10149 stop:10307 length:159 start_codon:yes stop_codon:yes gene_type:complete